jgi:hypothetical protein
LTSRCQWLTPEKNGQKSRRRNEEGRSLEIGTPSGTAFQGRLE